MTQETAADVLIHYFAQLACRIGVRWTDTNSTQVRAALRALAGDDLDTDTIPPYVEPVERDRSTVVLDHTSDPDFRAWRAQRRAQEEETQRRLLREASR